MIRNYYDTENQENVTFFNGTEVEHTPAFGMPTLFVVGLQDQPTISSYLNSAEHIFFGANQSFNPASPAEFLQWEQMIVPFLNLGYWCSLDIPVQYAKDFLETQLCEHHKFIPQISVKLPYINQWNYNTMIKLDDEDFNFSNPGVWTHSLHSLQDRIKFTDWSKYNNDKIIK